MGAKHTPAGAGKKDIFHRSLQKKTHFRKDDIDCEAVVLAAARGG
jgi:hypothetical protein